MNTPEFLSSLPSPLPSLGSTAAPGVLPTPAPDDPHGAGHAPPRRMSPATQVDDAPVADGVELAACDPASASTPASMAAPKPPRRDAASPAASGSRVTGAPTSATDLLAGLGRRFRGPTLRMRFELRTSIARQIFRRDFVYVSQQLHALEASRRVQGLPREDLNEALGAVGRRIDAVRTLLLHSAAHTRDLIALHGHEHSDIEFARPTVLQATIVSPYARDFMDVLVHADTALGELERAWLLGLIEPAEKGRLAGECRKAVQGVKEMVRQQRQLVGTRVRELNAHRAQEAEVAPTEGNDLPGLPARTNMISPGESTEGSAAAPPLVEVLEMDEMLHTREPESPDEAADPGPAPAAGETGEDA